MSDSYEKIMKLLKALTDGQKKRLHKCIQNDQGLLICVGIENRRMIEDLKHIDDIINENSIPFCSALRENSQLSSAFKAMIYRIIAPDDHMTDFYDFRMENWPEE